MSNNLVSRIEKCRPDEQEIYLTLKRDLSWREGFGILFVKCSPVQESWIIGKVKQDIPDKKIEVLKLEYSIDNLYDLIQEKVKDNPIDILFISGIEKSLALEDYIKRTLEKPKISHEKGSVSYLLGHLNWQRERFRDDFNCCLVFTVRKYTLKYLVRRAPDFFDWRSGVFEFPVDNDINVPQYYIPFKNYLKQKKQLEVFQYSELFYQKKHIDAQEYVSLLEELLLLEYENPGDSQFIYSVFKSNIDKLDDFFAQLLQQWIIDTCSQANPEEKEAILGIVESLCLDIFQFPVEKLSNFLEIAITGLETILKFRPREIFPEQWATTLNYLGNIYSNQTFGNRAKNLKKAINCYESVLQVITHEAFPLNWATTLNNLGLAYAQLAATYSNNSDLYKNVAKAENLKKAVNCYESALQVRTREAFPLDWATTLNNLAVAYTKRVGRDRVTNIEAALNCYFKALEVQSYKYFPQLIACLNDALKLYRKKNYLLQCAEIQNHLAHAYLEKIRGDKAKNVELAIDCLNDALRVCIKKKFPLQWAKIQNNLGNAYRERIRGDKAENIEQAIACLETALEVYTKQDLPLKWAETQNNLGNAYRERIRGNKAENIETAIVFFNDSLTVYTKENCQLQWAETQNHLAYAYRKKIRGCKAQNIELAIDCLNDALRLYMKENCQLQWAETQNHLAHAYRERIRGDKAENIELAAKSIELAIACLNDALRFYTKENFTLQRAEIQNHLAHAYRERIRGNKAENIEVAIACLETALEIYTKENCLLEWAEIQNHLAHAYRERIRGNKVENMEAAVASLQMTLMVYTPENFPVQWAEIQNNLAHAYQEDYTRWKQNQE